MYFGGIPFLLSLISQFKIRFRIAVIFRFAFYFRSQRCVEMMNHTEYFALCELCLSQLNWWNLFVSYRYCSDFMHLCSCSYEISILEEEASLVWPEVLSRCATFKNSTSTVCSAHINHCPFMMMIHRCSLYCWLGASRTSLDEHAAASRALFA
jgi:hypothetical protein